MDDMPTPREAIGLDGASEGDARGVERFLQFLENELMTMSAMGLFPAPLQGRLHELYRDTERTLEFVRGFIAAGSDKS